MKVESLRRSVNASLPSQTRNNGSLYAHIFIHPAGVHPFENQYVSHAAAPLTVYALAQDESINLLSEQKSKEVSQFKIHKIIMIISLELFIVMLSIVINITAFSSSTLSLVPGAIVGEL